MKNAHRVAVGNSVDNLKEHEADKLVVADVTLAFCDHGKQVAARAVVENNENVPVLLDDLVHASNAGVAGSELVQGDLSALKVALALVQTLPGETLDSDVLLRAGGVSCASTSVNAKIHNTVGPDAEDGDQLPSPVVDDLTDEVPSGGREVVRHSVALASKRRLQQRRNSLA